jgi:hypothetical protein
VLLAAEAAKARGNDLYAEGSFSAAAREYTAAARLYDASPAPQGRHALAEVLICRCCGCGDGDGGAAFCACRCPALRLNTPSLGKPTWLRVLVGWSAPLPTPTSVQVLSNRAAALVAQAKALKARPAAISERGGALFGQDPSTLAAMALKDARRAAALRPTWHKPSGRAAAALVMLERYEEAETAFEEGLLLAPDNSALLDGLEEARRMLRGSGAGPGPGLGPQRPVAPPAPPTPGTRAGTTGATDAAATGGGGDGAAAGSPDASDLPGGVCASVPR